MTAKHGPTRATSDPAGAKAPRRPVNASPERLLDSLLEKYAGAIIWEAPGGDRLSYAEWPHEKKEQLRSYVWSDPVLTDPPENQLADLLLDDERAYTMLCLPDAWSHYLAHVANGLLLEFAYLKGQPIVPWSLERYPSTLWGHFFDSFHFYKWTHDFVIPRSTGPYHTGRSGYVVSENSGDALPAPPSEARGFLAGSGLIGSDCITTITGVLEWCRDNLVHFIGGLTAGNVEDQWQYRGLPPVTRILQGTPFTSRSSEGIQNRTAGCHGTNGFLLALLRVVNIPVLYRLAPDTGHATPYFAGEGKYLSHGDDPYGRTTHAVPPYSAELFLISEERWAEWFGPHVPLETRKNNVGRRALELSLEYLPNYLLDRHCRDMATGKPHSESELYEVFSRCYSLDELESEDLWGRIQQKINGFGGCGNIPPWSLH